jgi:hypothetical protein
MKTVAIVCTMALLAGCGGRKSTSAADAAGHTRPLMVYRTAQDVHDKVPVGLSEDRKHIVSYPQPADLMVDGKLLLPTKLAKGWWLDNKGIGLNTGYLKLTYAEYAALPQAPSIADMEAMLLDVDPLVSLCDCGTSGAMADPVKEINALVKKDALRERCKVLK